MQGEAPSVTAVPCCNSLPCLSKALPALLGWHRPPEAFPEGSEGQSGSIFTLPGVCHEDTTPWDQGHFAASVASGMSSLFGVAMENVGPLVV